MSCLICLENTNNIISNKCDCKIECHHTCFKDFLKNSKFSCPICRIRRGNIYNNSNRSDLMYIVFRLPGPIALLLWFIISILFTMFILPFIAIKEIYGNKYAIITYTIMIYLCRTMSVLYPMIITHCCVLCLHYLNIKVI